MDPFSRPKIRKVTIEIEDYPGNVVRFTYLAELPGEQPDPGAGMELELQTTSTRDAPPWDQAGPFRRSTVQHSYDLHIDKARTYTVDIAPAQPPATATSRPGKLEDGTLAVGAGEAG